MNKQDIKALWQLLEPVRWRVCLACVLQVLAAAIGVVPFVVIVHMVFAMLGGELEPGLAFTLTYVVLLSIAARIILSIGAGTITHYADNAFHYHVRKAMVDTLRVIPLLSFSKYHSGGLKKNLQDDVGTMHHLIAHFILDLINSVVQPLIIICYLATFSLSFTLVTLIPSLLSLVVYIWQLNSFSRHIQEYTKYLMEINAATVELVQGIGAIKVFPMQTGVPQRFINASSRFVTAFGDWVKDLMPLGSATEILVSPLASVVWICGTGLLFINFGMLEPMLIIPMLLVGAGLGTPLITLVGTLAKLQEATQAAKQVVKLLDEPRQKYLDFPKQPHGNDVSFKNVTFGYDANWPVLKNISFSMPPKTLTALVGASGAGKTTLAHLLLRFADPQSGSITYGGVDLRDMGAKELGQQIGFVFQDAYLIRASVLDNIRLARPDASLEEVMDAAQNAQIHEKILSCPKGYQSIVDVDMQFSGGEQQRLAIARALLADTPVLILDEPTSHADPLSEAALQKAISNLSRNKTMLVIAHRLHTISRADQIIVLDNGEIAEQGTHQDLLTINGRYARMWLTAHNPCAHTPVLSSITHEQEV